MYFSLLQAYCRQLEQQLGRARAELEKLQQVRAVRCTTECSAALECMVLLT